MAIISLAVTTVGIEKGRGTASKNGPESQSGSKSRCAEELPG
jgi:hypothetical protein